MKKFLALILALAMVFALCACGQPATPASTPAAAASAQPDSDAAEPAAELPEVKVVLASAGGATNIETVYSEKWMALVTERTDGKVTFDYTNGGAMGSYADLVDGVNNGAYDMTMTDIAQLEPYAPEIAVAGLPFLMADYDHLKSVYTGDAWDYFQSSVDSGSNMVLLNAFFCGFREILSVDELKTVDDFKGYLIRVPQTEAFTKVFDALGFSYTTLAWSDCYTGMQTGVINAIETALMSLYNTGFYDLGKYVLLSNHMQAVNGMVANKDFWNALPEEYRTVMTEAFEELREQEWDECISNEDYYRSALEEKGCTVNEVSAEDRAKLTEMVQSYWTEVTDKVGGTSADMVQYILSLQK